MSLHSPLAIAASAVLLVSRALAGQGTPTVPPVRLSPANATHPAEFTVVAGVRELSDGRVLVTDEKDGVLVAVDFRAGTSLAVGRTGNGPGEYRQVGRLWPLGGDSTLLKEPFAPRWLLLRGVEVVATLGPGDPTVRAVGMMPIMGSDTRGGIGVVQFGRDASGRPTLDDSLLLVRVARPSLRVDTITRLGSPTQWERGAGVTPSPPAVAAAGGGAPAERRYALGLQVQDQVAVFADGWIAIARTDPYRVDWCAPGRACAIGRPLDTTRPPMSARERQAYLQAMQQMRGWPPTTDVSAVSGWPNVIPPFTMPSQRIDGSAVLAMPDGRLMVERLPTAESRMRRYDIVSRRGEIAGRVLLPFAERIVGFGARAVYLAVADADGVERLRRHAWP
jgi:hypothetical protein